MTNSEIVERLEDAMALMEMMDFNVFKINSFRTVSQQIDKLNDPLRLMSSEARGALFSKTMAKNIEELIETETFAELAELERQIPKGVRNMLLINGIGPKKVKTLWKEAGIENVVSLKDACLSGQVSLLKGFGGKIQETILSGINFLESIEGKMLMHKGEELAASILQSLTAAGVNDAVVVGDLQMMSEVVSAIEFLVPVNQFKNVQAWLGQSPDYELDLVHSSPYQLSAIQSEKNVAVRFFFAGEENWVKHKFLLNTTNSHWESASVAGVPLYKTWLKGEFNSEEELFEKLTKPFLPVDLRVGVWEWQPESEEKLKTIVGYSDLKGPLHNHSTYSDGKNSLLEMAQWCIDQGWEYFGIADHSKSAHYAQGLYEEKVERQWVEIDKLNQELKPFKILKGIESDILQDGSLDYPEDILAGFDYIVASVHSGMKMDIDTATARLIKAVENPHTTILGHCSGRILLRRSGYPLHYQKIIDACIANGVAIEVNAHPARLDMDWYNLSKALEKGAIISINPDAHRKEDLNMMSYGTYMARKAGADRNQVLNAMNLNEIQDFFQKKRAVSR